MSKPVWFRKWEENCFETLSTDFTIFRTETATNMNWLKWASRLIIGGIGIRLVLLGFGI